MDLQNSKKIHFIGLGGIGTSAVAKFFRLQGKEVSGSDLEQTEITDECEALGIRFIKGHKAENIPTDADLVVYSDAVPQDNPERSQANKLIIPQMSYAEVLGEISKTKRTIAVSGTNGKSTTTAMLGLILEAAGFDPTVIVGSKVKTFKYGNLQVGAGDWLVVEGDEYRDHMLHLQPEVIVLTNIELDHTDYFKDLDSIIESFGKYLNLLPPNGYCVLNNDDLGTIKLKNTDIFQFLIRANRRIVNYSTEKNKADYQAESIIAQAGEVKFDVRGTSWGDVFSCKLHIPGCFNVYNALAAISCARTLGIPIDVTQKTLANFYGIWRRFERVGTRNGALIISDYAHHPTAVKATIAAAREFFPHNRIVAVFQPHHRNRTKYLFNDFIKAFDGANLSILSEIYDVAGRELRADENISSMDLVRAINSGDVIYGGDLEQTKELIMKNVKDGDVVLMMGAGSIDRVARELVNSKL